MVGLTADLLVENVDTNAALRMSLAHLARSQELEADRIGVALALRAGFRAHGAQEVLDDFARMRDDERLSWTHDRPSVRLEALRRSGLLGGALSRGP